MINYLSKREFARRIGRSIPTVLFHIKRGHVELVEYATKAKGIPEEEVQKFLNKYGEKRV